MNFFVLALQRAILGSILTRVPHSWQKGRYSSPSANFWKKEKVKIVREWNGEMTFRRRFCFVAFLIIWSLLVECADYSSWSGTFDWSHAFASPSAWNCSKVNHLLLFIVTDDDICILRIEHILTSSCPCPLPFSIKDQDLWSHAWSGRVLVSLSSKQTQPYSWCLCKIVAAQASVPKFYHSSRRSLSYGLLVPTHRLTKLLADWSSWFNRTRNWVLINDSIGPIAM